MTTVAELPAAERAVERAAEARRAPRLIGAVADALLALGKHIEQGLEIKNMRVRNPAELDEARRVKMSWITGATDLLNSLFDSPAIAEECNDWVGKIYPEYAEFENFVAQFYAEMDHRVRRLQSVQTRLEKAARAVQNIPPAPRHPELIEEPVARPAQTPAPNLQTVLDQAVQPKMEKAADAATLPRKESEPVSSLAASTPHAAVIISGPQDEPARQKICGFIKQLEVAHSVVESSAGGGLSAALERSATNGFAVFMSTPGTPGELMFALGVCVGRFGAKRVVVVRSSTESAAPQVEGLSVISLDPTGGWQLELARAMKGAGVPVDLNRLL